MYEGLKGGKTAKEKSGYAPMIDWENLCSNMNFKMQHNLFLMQVDLKLLFSSSLGQTYAHKSWDYHI